MEHERNRWDEHDRMYVDFYIGRGVNDPPLTHRTARSEDRLSSLEKYNVNQESKRDTKTNLILGGMVTLIIGFLLAHFKVI